MEDSDLLGINNNDVVAAAEKQQQQKQHQANNNDEAEEKKEVDLLSPSFNNDDEGQNNIAQNNNTVLPSITTSTAPSSSDVEAIFEGGNVTTTTTTTIAATTPTSASAAATTSTGVSSPSPQVRTRDHATIVNLPPVATPKAAAPPPRPFASAGANAKQRSTNNNTPVSRTALSNVPVPPISTSPFSPPAAAPTDYFSASPSARLRDTFASFIPASLTARHTLPDKTVASQVLMYRQLLHTECRPGLKLSREFQGTPAQVSVMYMPWWEKNVAQTKRMSISYDNLITRLWIYGAILPFVIDDNPDDENNEQQQQQQQQQHGQESTTESPANDAISASSSFGTTATNATKRQAALEAAEEGSAQNNLTSVDQACEKRGIDTMMNEKGLPPIPHEFWVARAGFQQNDPVTDFRSGGVLSLAMLLHIVESCPLVHARFIRPHGDASVLPFGITSINVTDMLAKICMFSKAIDKMDALLTAKPFWKMFNDPNSILALQELSMDILADVVVELSKLKKLHILADENDKANVPSKMKDPPRGVTVFDFPEILEKTEKRVRDDLLNSGPRTVEELRTMAFKLRIKYAKACEKKERALQKKVQDKEAALLKQQEQQQQKKEDTNTAKTTTTTTVSSIFGMATGTAACTGGDQLAITNSGSAITTTTEATPTKAAATPSSSSVNNAVTAMSGTFTTEGLFSNIWGSGGGNSAIKEEMPPLPPSSTTKTTSDNKQRMCYEFARPVQEDNKPPAPQEGNLISLI